MDSNVLRIREYADQHLTSYIEDLQECLKDPSLRKRTKHSPGMPEQDRKSLSNTFQVVYGGFLAETDKSHRNFTN